MLFQARQSVASARSICRGSMARKLKSIRTWGKIAADQRLRPLSEHHKLSSKGRTAKHLAPLLNLQSTHHRNRRPAYLSTAHRVSTLRDNKETHQATVIYSLHRSFNFEIQNLLPVVRNTALAILPLAPNPATSLHLYIVLSPRHYQP